MDCRVTIQWTDTAVRSLRQLPRKVREGLIAKIDGLKECDPREVYKPLVGPLNGYRSVKYSRFRAIFRTEVEELVSGDVLVHIKVQVVLAGTRKARDKNDVYAVAKKLVELGVIPAHEVPGSD